MLFLRSSLRPEGVFVFEKLAKYEIQRALSKGTVGGFDLIADSSMGRAVRANAVWLD